MPGAGAGHLHGPDPGLFLRPDGRGNRPDGRPHGRPHRAGGHARQRGRHGDPTGPDAGQGADRPGRGPGVRPAQRRILGSTPSMNETYQGEFQIESEGDIVAARRVVRNAATALGFGITDVTRIVTAASELTRNIYQYAKRGVMRWQVLSRSNRAGLELTFEDHGPGIEDVPKAMELGFT